MRVSRAMPTPASTRPAGTSSRALTLDSKMPLPTPATTTRTRVSGRNAKPVLTALYWRVSSR